MITLTADEAQRLREAQREERDARIALEIAIADHRPRLLRAVQVRHGVIEALADHYGFDATGQFIFDDRAGTLMPRLPEDSGI